MHLKAFKRIILSRLLFFLEANSIFSPRQICLLPDGVLSIKFCFFLRPFRMGLTNPILALERFLVLSLFLKLSTLVWHHLAISRQVISAGLLSCFARWTRSFLSNTRAGMFFQNHKSLFFRLCQGIPQGLVFDPVLFSISINDLPAFLPSSVSCFLYADDLAI